MSEGTKYSTVMLWAYRYSLSLEYSGVNFSAPDLVSVTELVIGIVKDPGNMPKSQKQTGLRALELVFLDPSDIGHCFGSLVENLPEIPHTIAREMGLTVGQLRARLLDGKLTAQDVFDALAMAATEGNSR